MTRPVLRALLPTLACLLLAVGALSPAAPALAAAPAGTHVVFRLDDPRIDEASGIGVGIRSPGVVYVQNDSGDSARFFALDARTGRTLAVCDVPNASNVDWEDLAVAPDANGTASVWLADIGDNRAARASVVIYRVDEPRVDLRDSGATLTTSAPQVWRLRYPSGPVDAESLAVSPDGRAYLVTKSLIGRSTVYAVPDTDTTGDGPRAGTLRRIGSIRFPVTGTANPFSIAGNLAATGAALSRDGRLLAVRTYSDAYLWPVVGGDVADALHAAPVRVALPSQPQGEGITFDGSHLLIDSEHAGSAVYSVAVPATLHDTSRTGASATSTPSAPSASPSPSRTKRSPSVASRSAGGVLLLLIVAGAWALSRSLRTRRRRPPGEPGSGGASGG